MTDGIYALDWTKENRLTRVSKNGTILGDYEYDPMGRRSKKTANQTNVTKFIMAGGNVIDGVRVN